MISVIIPTYNEANNIEEVVERINKVLTNHEIIVVDDNSPDGTYEKAKDLENVKAICRQKEKGLSSAVIDGFKLAKGDVVGVIDADLQHPPEMIPKLVENLKTSDIVVGSRIARGGRVEKWPVHRKLISVGARMLAYPLTKVKDSQSGFFFMKRLVIENAKINPIGYKILLEILVKGDYNSVKEVPYVFQNREQGDSKLSGKIYMEYLVHLFRLYKYKLKK